MLKYAKSIVKIVGLIALVGLLSIKIVQCANETEKEHEQIIENYEASGRLEVFEKYNKEYKIADTQMKKVIVGVTGHLSYGFKIVNNYISNVQGEILDREIIKDSDNANIVYFTINIPVDAKYGDNLQQEINMYVLYDFLANKKYMEKSAFFVGVKELFIQFKDMQIKAGI